MVEIESGTGLWTPTKDILRIAYRHAEVIELYDHDPADLKDHHSCKRGCRPFESHVTEVYWSAPDGLKITRESDPDRFYAYEHKYHEQNPGKD